jgi:hypothetical protein
MKHARHISSAAAFNLLASLPLLLLLLLPLPNHAAVANWHLAGLFPGELQLHYSETIPECLSGFLLPPEQMPGTARETNAASTVQ